MRPLPFLAPGRGAFVLVPLLTTLLSACGEEWRPGTYVGGMRVLAIRADPPELAPGAVARLSSVVVAPSAAQKTLIWLACDPDPSQLDQSECAKYATLEEAADLGDVSSLPEGVKPLGFGTEAVYQAPANLFAQVASDDPRRTRGVLTVVLMMAVAAPLPATPEELQALMEKVRSGEIPSLLSIKRIRISEESVHNENPVLESVRLGDEVLTGSGARPTKVRPGQLYTLVGNAAEGSAERFQQLDPFGNLVEKDEPLLVSWFSTAGLFSVTRTPAGDDSQRFIVPQPFDEPPAGGRVTLYAVLRDGRGGVDWLQRGLFVCDPFREAPTIVSVEPASGPPQTTVALRGERLDDVIDVALGTGYLSSVRWDPDLEALVGTVASDAAPGPTKLVVRGKGCRPDPEAAFEVTQ